MSTEGFTRIFWVVLDGMGFEHARLCMESGRFPALTQIAREGYLGPIRPSSPVCQTPPALLALFTGSEPAENGVWGYHMPDQKRLDCSVSGFSTQIRGVRAIWHELEDRGLTYSLMNVAFRYDPVWAGKSPHLDFAYDGYRMWKRPAAYRLYKGTTRINHGGIDLRVVSSREGFAIRKGGAVITTLAPGQGATISLTRGTRVFAHLLDPSNFLVYPLIPVVTRGTGPAMSTTGGFLDMSAFKIARKLFDGGGRSADVPASSVLLPSEVSIRQKADLMLAAARSPSTSLVVGYFPVVDEFNHAWFDLLEGEWPDGRASELFADCVALIDSFLDRLMRQADPGTLLVLSSDHGAASHRQILHMNELFAEAGLVKRAPGGYDLRRSVLFYHPSDCGQVVVNSAAANATAARGRGMGPDSLLAAVHRIVDRANRDYSARIALEPGRQSLPYVAFLYPLGDTYFTGRALRKGRPTLDRKKQGGHHLSPLSPTPWIQAMLGLWSPSTRARALGTIPDANSELKTFLLDLLATSP